ncbi:MULTISPECIES: hypothetical protein [Clostridium]|uniref:Immunity protein 53 n=1 Tax=Clostridium frigoriphilum TaxID=443253 RepID=A0ABU7UXD1_9CLOT|nr:hypothetical protein [Clostridium sp. DSM 17811]MBU3102322.1 hypothetical protein [Clostridium sp. DSM 17811]
MIWEIEEKEDVMWYTSDVCKLKLKESENKINIWLNYKGYNIIMSMGMWGFDEEVSERGIKYDIGGDSMEEWYFILEKKNLRLFVDLVYFFIKEHNADKMININLGIKKWS